MAPINVDVVNGSKVESSAKKSLPEVETDSNGQEHKRYDLIYNVCFGNFFIKMYLHSLEIKAK